MPNGGSRSSTIRMWTRFPRCTRGSFFLPSCSVGISGAVPSSLCGFASESTPASCQHRPEITPSLQALRDTVLCPSSDLSRSTPAVIQIAPRFYLCTRFGYTPIPCRLFSPASFLSLFWWAGSRWICLRRPRTPFTLTEQVIPRTVWVFPFRGILLQGSISRYAAWPTKSQKLRHCVIVVCHAVLFVQALWQS